MLRLSRHGDVTELQLSSWRSRMPGFRMHLYVRGDLLIDAGFPSATAELARALPALGVQRVAITHYHEDHAGTVAALARMELGLWLPPGAADRLVRPTPLAWYRRITWGSPAALGPFVPADLPEGLEPIPTPGHTHDHHAFWDPASATVWGGDLFIGIKVRIAHHDENPYAIVRALRRVIALRPARYFDAHRGLLTDAVSALEAKATWMEDRIAAAQPLIARGDDDASIARVVLGSDRFGRFYTGGEYTMANWIAGVRAGPQGA